MPFIKKFVDMFDVEQNALKITFFYLIYTEMLKICYKID